MRAPRKMLRLASAIVAVLVLGASVAATSASAELQYPLLGEIGPTVPGGRFNGGSELLAYNGTSVLELNSEYVNAFGADGEPEGSIPKEVKYGAIAANEVAGDIYIGGVEYREKGQIMEGVIQVLGANGDTLFRIDSSGNGKPVHGGLGEVRALAVDQASGNVYAFDRRAHQIDVFSGSGEFLFQISGAGGMAFSEFVFGLAVDDSSGLLLVGNEEQNAKGIVYALQASTGAYVSTWTGVNTPQNEFYGRLLLATEKATGDVYVLSAGDPKVGAGLPVVDRFDASGEFKSAIDGPPGEPFELRGVKGIAVGHEGDVYVLEKCAAAGNSTCPSRPVPSRSNPGGVIYVFAANPVAIPHVRLQPIGEVKPTSAVLHGLVNPEGTGEATCAFEYGTSSSYGQSASCSANVSEGSAPVQVEASLTGLRSGTTYYYRLDGTNVGDGQTNTGEGSEDLGQFTTPGPRVASEGVFKVTGESVSFQAEVAPNGMPTSAYVEYGTSEAYGSAAPVAPGVAIGVGSVPVEFFTHVQGLLSSTTYHYRFVTVSEIQPGKFETVNGPDRTFTTQSPAAGFMLPDGRTWELVTPAEKRGALFFSQNYGNLLGVSVRPLVSEAAADGGAIANLASVPTEAQPQGYVTEVTVLSLRGPGGWYSRVINPPHSSRAAGTALGEGGEYEFFSQDLSKGLVDPFGSFAALSSEATEPTPYIRTDYAAGAMCEGSCYRPLVTAGNTEAGVRFGEEVEPGAGCPFICGPAFVDATPDLSFVALSSRVQLTSVPNEPSAPGGTGGGSYYYEWGEGGLQPLYLLPISEGGGGVFAGRPSSVEHQMAADGAVFFIYKAHLYLHDFKQNDAVRLDIARGVSEPGAGGVRMLYASSDGSRVLFEDSKPLTSVQSGGLYECVIVQTGGVPGCEARLTGMPTGELIGGSDDASYLYFKDLNGRLIVDHRGDKGWMTTTGPYIGSLPESNTVLAGSGNNVPVTSISPNGMYLTFMSGESLTGYDNHDALNGKSDIEVYLYDAVTNKLVCASCNPTGARPVGVEYDEQKQLVAGSLGEEREWVAANLPPWTRSEYHENRYQPRFLSDDGRLFFDSHDALVAQDANGTQDVYEYEPSGVGSCTAASASYSGLSDGCVNLISSGASADESSFLDASENGSDVFFLTSEKLVPTDFDSALDVYDAHECSVVSPCAPPTTAAPPPCSTGDSCKAAPTPQPAIFGEPSSATFVGHGNVIQERASSPTTGKAKSKSLSRAQMLARALKVCQKKHGARRTACRRDALRRYGRSASVGHAHAGVHGKRR